jgi:tricorn protease
VLPPYGNSGNLGESFAEPESPLSPTFHGLVAAVAALTASGAALAQPEPSGSPLRLLQRPAISRDLIAFSYAGDIWTAPRTGGRATRLTTGVGIETGPIFSPDGSTIAFTGEYDGDVDVYTVPASGGVPRRVTWHPGADSAVAWSADGKSILFRSARDAASRYTQLYTTSALGGPATPLPLPMAYAGAVSPDGRAIAYNPLAPAFGFDFTSFVAWGNYHGGRAGTIRITTLPGLASTEAPHEAAADFSPVWLGDKVYFLSGRRGRIGVFSYDPATKAVAEVYHNDGDADIRSLATDGRTLIFDRLGELYTLEPGAAPKRLDIDVVGDMPDVRPRILNVAAEIQAVSLSPTGVRVAVEAHGEILTAPVKHGPIRDLTNTPGVMEREPAWSPDGQKVAYFSDESGAYALHVTGQTGARDSGPAPVRKYLLGAAPAYYFHPVWSPDSSKIAFRDNRLHNYVLDLTSGAVRAVGEPDTFGGFAAEQHAVAWSPDSRWLVYPHSTSSHMHVLMLWSAATGGSTQLTDAQADAHDPAFDRNGKYLYFLASNNSGAAAFGLDMTSDLYNPTSSIYALALTRDTVSPLSPLSDDEKTVAEARDKAKDATDATPAGVTGEAKAEAKATPHAPPRAVAQAVTAIDVAGLGVDAIGRRIVALPPPPGDYRDLSTGKPGALYVLRGLGATDSEARGTPPGTLLRWALDERKSETLADHVASYAISADGEKMLLAQVSTKPGEPAPPGGPPPKPSYRVVAADKPVKAGDEDGALDLSALEVRVDPPAEWAQMFHEVWRIERAYFYDPAFHGFDTAAEEKRVAPLLAGVQSRADLNYVFQEMLTGFSVDHLRGSGGAIPAAPKVMGGLLGADYTIIGDHWRVSKIYTGGAWSPQVKAPLAQPGVDIAVGDCILRINGAPVTAAMDIQEPLEGTAGHAVVLTIAPACGRASREVTVVPVASEAVLRNLDWIESNRRKVAAMSGGKLAYVYLPDTGAGGFTAFNREYFAQTDRQGAVIDERFNAGGQVADYIVEVLGRKPSAYWQPRYGAVERSPAASIQGPKVMIANEQSGSGGDALPWLFRYNQLGTLVGKRTWGGLVGIGPTPVLMDGGQVTSPSVGFFSPKGEWDVENHGVEPDITVDQDPKAVAEGHDPQLEAAVAVALRDMAKSPAPSSPTRPPFPVYGRPAP